MWPQQTLQPGGLELAFEFSHYPEDDPLLPLRQAGAPPQYGVRGLVAEALKELRVQHRLLFAIHEV